MARVLLLILLVWILYAVIKRIIAKSEFRNSASANKTDEAGTDEKSAEQIVQCSQCGLHVPESDSHIKNGLITCNNPECNRIQ